jgi:hypothetical protein
MASEYYGINRGQHQVDVVFQASSPGKNVEVKVDLTAGMNKEEVLRHLQMIMEIIVKGNWPPA